MKSAPGAGKNSVCGALEAEESEVYLQETLDVNVFMRGFLKDLYLRPSCHECPAKSGKSHSDITIADFWGVSRYFPEYDDDRGVGLVLVNTEKGNQILSSLKIDKIESSFEQAVAGNPAIVRSARLHKWRENFWKEYSKNCIDAIVPVCEKMKPGLLRSIYCKIRLRAVKLIKKIIRRK